MKPKALLARLARRELANVSFGDVQRLVEALGFTLDRVAGQLRQLLQLIDRHALTLPEETQ